MLIANQGITVQKYGGSSLSSPEKICRVARKIAELRSTGRPVVVVVSATGNTTSELVGRAKRVASTPSRRELDMLLSSGERVSMALLAMAIQEEGREAISLTGPQSGIVTDSTHANATIREVRPERVLRELEAGRVVIVAGYQGVSPEGEVTTLGRGGSDTTAVALAGALRAEVCEIYSDVDGVYTADPRNVENVRHLSRVDSAVMTEYARRGAGVLHAPCLDLARREGVAVRARSTFGGDAQTWISCGAE
ncbi:MAG: aspartate kinase, partial [Planctomycetota bacterium JB042]